MVERRANKYATMKFLQDAFPGTVSFAHKLKLGKVDTEVLGPESDHFQMGMVIFVTEWEIRHPDMPKLAYVDKDDKYWISAMTTYSLILALFAKQKTRFTERKDQPGLE